MKRKWGGNHLERGQTSREEVDGGHVERGAISKEEVTPKHSGFKKK